MAAVNEAKLDKLVKGGKSHSETAAGLGLTIGQLPMIQYTRAQVRTGQFSKIPATAASVKKARNEGNRWELIAARADISVAKVKDLFGGESAAQKSYTGRGRNFSGSKPSGKKAGSAANKARGGKSAAKPKRARTLKERQARAGNPS
jgi:hypothetical protein